MTASLTANESKRKTKFIHSKKQWVRHVQLVMTELARFALQHSLQLPSTMLGISLQIQKFPVKKQRKNILQRWVRNLGIKTHREQQHACVQSSSNIRQNAKWRSTQWKCQTRHLKSYIICTTAFAQQTTMTTTTTTTTTTKGLPSKSPSKLEFLPNILAPFVAT